MQTVIYLRKRLIHDQPQKDEAVLQWSRSVACCCCWRFKIRKFAIHKSRVQGYDRRQYRAPSRTPKPRIIVVYFHSILLDRV